MIPGVTIDESALRRLGAEGRRFTTTASLAAEAAGLTLAQHRRISESYAGRVDGDLDFLRVEIEEARDLLSVVDGIAMPSEATRDLIATAIDAASDETRAALRSFPCPPAAAEDAAEGMALVLAYCETWRRARASRYGDWIRLLARVQEDRECSIPRIDPDTGRLAGFVEPSEITPESIVVDWVDGEWRFRDGRVRTRHAFKQGDVLLQLYRTDPERFRFDFPADEDGITLSAGARNRKATRAAFETAPIDLESTPLTFRGLESSCRIYVPDELKAPSPGSMDIGEILDWSPMKGHPEQDRIDFSPSMPRTVYAPAGRRSGKSFIFTRKLVAAFLLRVFGQGIKTHLVFVEPTADMAERIIWRELAFRGGHAFVPDALLDATSGLAPRNNTKKTLFFADGSTIRVESAEGRTIEGDGSAPFFVVVDEMRYIVHNTTTYNTLARAIAGIQAGSAGYVFYTGTPDGRNAYTDGCDAASAKNDARECLAIGDEQGARAALSRIPDADVDAMLATPEISLDEMMVSWHTDWKKQHGINPPPGVAPAREIMRQRSMMTAAQWLQEFQAEASKVQGAAYSSFNYETHVGATIGRWSGMYNATMPLLVGLDFNREPGVAVLCQVARNQQGTEFLVVIAEVFIALDSDTWKVCDEIIDRFGDHQGHVHVYGDAAGKQRRSSAASTDWQIVTEKLGGHFADRFKRQWKESNPAQKDRVNAMNALLMNACGEARMYIERACVKVIRDLEGVVADPDGSLRSKQDEGVGHISDALGYIVVSRFPIHVLPAASAPRRWS